MLTPDVATRKLSIQNREKVRISNLNYIENLQAEFLKQYPKYTFIRHTKFDYQF
jgi:hypothetical protein